MKKTIVFLLAAMLACMILTGCGSETPPAAGGEPANTAGEENTPAEDAEDGAENESAGSEKPKPIYANQIQDGTYTIEVSSSSSMFRIVDARLTVAGGEMWAVLTLSGDGYLKLYMGTGEEASADTDDKCIYYVEDDEGRYTYKVPVAALDQDTDVAAWSIRKEKWYDRVLVFQSSMIPENALLPVQTAAELPPDGRYTIEVALSGGSGRAHVESPAELTVMDDAATAVVVWGSSYYGYMLADGIYYYPVNTDGNSTFEIPVSLDEDMAVSAQTVAMSEPHIIDYTLRFDSATLKPHD